MKIKIISFGFKHGPQPPVETMFDVRFLPNPYYVPELQKTTGLAPKTAAYAIDNETASDFFLHLLPLLDFLISQYQRTNREQLTIGIGCTGGKHRSVAVAEALGRRLASEDCQLIVIHRDIEKP